eukprot:TRINITY_DN7113_c0_g1_i1.p1 TRINITY_DN7113_c0_g1~~TRINITY_DN7113_c0_g1_i1.p1  ORF type:complete len:940 (+),score=162.70 TRINITY_DN7113_c0_g1_i1:844-3663(+)
MSRGIVAPSPPAPSTSSTTSLGARNRKRSRSAGSLSLVRSPASSPADSTQPPRMETPSRVVPRQKSQEEKFAQIRRGFRVLAKLGTGIMTCARAKPIEVEAQSRVYVGLERTRKLHANHLLSLLEGYRGVAAERPDSGAGELMELTRKGFAVLAEISRHTRLLLTGRGRAQSEIDQSVTALIAHSREFRDIIMNLKALSSEVAELAAALFSKADELSFPQWVMLLGSKKWVWRQVFLNSGLLVSPEGASGKREVYNLIGSKCSPVLIRSDAKLYTKLQKHRIEAPPANLPATPAGAYLKVELVLGKAKYLAVPAADLHKWLKAIRKLSVGTDPRASLDPDAFERQPTIGRGKAPRTATSVVLSGARSPRPHSAHPPGTSTITAAATTTSTTSTVSHTTLRPQSTFLRGTASSLQRSHTQPSPTPTPTPSRTPALTTSRTSPSTPTPAPTPPSIPVPIPMASPSAPTTLPESQSQMEQQHEEDDFTTSFLEGLGADYVELLDSLPPALLGPGRASVIAQQQQRLSSSPTAPSSARPSTIPSAQADLETEVDFTQSFLEGLGEDIVSLLDTLPPSLLSIPRPAVPSSSSDPTATISQVPLPIIREPEDRRSHKLLRDASASRTRPQSTAYQALQSLVHTLPPSIRASVELDTTEMSSSSSASTAPSHTVVKDQLRAVLSAAGLRHSDSLSSSSSSSSALPDRASLLGDGQHASEEEEMEYRSLVEVLEESVVEVDDTWNDGAFAPTTAAELLRLIPSRNRSPDVLALFAMPYFVPLDLAARYCYQARLDTHCDGPVRLGVRLAAFGADVSDFPDFLEQMAAHFDRLSCTDVLNRLVTKERQRRALVSTDVLPVLLHLQHSDAYVRATPRDAASVKLDEMVTALGRAVKSLTAFTALNLQLAVVYGAHLYLFPSASDARGKHIRLTSPALFRSFELDADGDF